MYFLLFGFLSDPAHDFLLLDDGFPLVGAPFKLGGFFIGDAWRPANEDDAGLIAFPNLHKAKHKYVGVSANEALDGEVSKFTFGVCGDLVVLGLDQVEDDVRGESVLPLNASLPTFSLQNHFPHVLFEQRTTQLLLRTPQNAHACAGNYYSADTVDERSDSSYDSDFGFSANII